MFRDEKMYKPRVCIDNALKNVLENPRDFLMGIPRGNVTTRKLSLQKPFWQIEKIQSSNCNNLTVFYFNSILK